MTSGFKTQANGLTISKDPQAELTYSFDWQEWLTGGDQIIQAEYSAQVRANDPQPIQIESFGLAGTKTYVTLSSGQLNKSYTITAKVTTAQGLVDRRNFIVRIENRSA